MSETTAWDVPTGRESGDWGVDPGSGARVIRLTSAPALSHNIYCEQPYCSPDGQRLLVSRRTDLFDPGCALLVADLPTRTLHRIEADIPSESVAHAAWGEYTYYPLHDGSLRRLSFSTFARDEVLPPGSITAPHWGGIQSITEDGQWLIGHILDERLETYALNLQTGERQVIYAGDDNRNAHAQAERGGGGQVLYQLIRSGETTGVPVFARGLTGGATRQLPFGAPWTAESSGHMAWIGDTGRVACALNWQRDSRSHDPRHPQGNVAIAAPGDAQPTVFTMPEHALYHVSVSRCGRYFVGDDFMDFEADAYRRGPAGPIRIVVGCFASGRYRVLVADAQCAGIAGSSRFEPDPYLTADNRYVIYNGSPFGTMQVFAAALPPDFLPSLDG